MQQHSFTPGAGSDDFQFGDWLVQPSLNQLHRESECRRLEPKIMDVRVRVAAGGGAVVPRATIIDAIWSARYVSDSVLTRATAQIRRTLGDSCSSPRYIETVSRRGYRVVATITRRPADIGPQAQSAFTLTIGDKTVTLAEGETLVGHDRAATVQVDSPEASRRHARITVLAGNAILEDLGSGNGTFLNGVRLIRPARVSDGDLILVADSVLTIHRERYDDITIARG